MTLLLDSLAHRETALFVGQVMVRVAFTTTGVELYTVVSANCVVVTLLATGESQVILVIVEPINIGTQ